LRISTVLDNTYRTLSGEPSIFITSTKHPTTKNKKIKQTNRSQLLTHKLKCIKPETEQEKIKILHSPPTVVPKANFNSSIHHTTKIIKVSNPNSLHNIFLFD
jgi:hypothetical protein